MIELIEHGVIKLYLEWIRRIQIIQGLADMVNGGMHIDPRFQTYIRDGHGHMGFGYSKGDIALLLAERGQLYISHKSNQTTRQPPAKSISQLHLILLTRLSVKDIVGVLTLLVGLREVSACFHFDPHQIEEIGRTTDQEELYFFSFILGCIGVISILRTHLFHRKSHILDTGIFLQTVGIDLVVLHIQSAAQLYNGHLIFVEAQLVVTHIAVLQSDKE